MTISALHMEWLDKRGILTAAMDIGIYSAQRVADGQVLADGNGDILVFPFIRHSRESVFGRNPIARRHSFTATFLMIPA